MADWVEACAVDEVEEEDVIRFDHGGRTFAVYRSPDDAFFDTDCNCTHEKAHAAYSPMESSFLATQPAVALRINLAGRE